VSDLVSAQRRSVADYSGPSGPVLVDYSVPRKTCGFRGLGGDLCLRLVTYGRNVGREDVLATKGSDLSSNRDLSVNVFEAGR